MPLRTFVVALALWAGITSACFADRWMAAKPRDYVSKNRQFRLKVVPTKSGFGQAKATLVTTKKEENKQQEESQEKVLWKVELVNTPIAAFVSGNGQYVVTRDTYASVGYAHSLVIYGAQGELIRDFQLEDLLTEKELHSKRVFITRSSRWWVREGITFSFSTDNHYFLIKLDWGRVIRVELATGKLVVPSKRV